MTDDPHAPRVVVTRVRSQADPLNTLLREVGLTPISCPMLRIAPLPTPPALARVLDNRIDWIVFTSDNAVTTFSDRLADLGRPFPPRAQIAAVGGRTARTLADSGHPPAFIPEEQRGEALARALDDVEGRRILFPCSRLARNVLPSLLRARGAEVVRLELYDTVPDTPTPEERAVLDAGFEAVVFLSPSAVHNFVAWADEPLRTRSDRSLIGCIGPTTAAASREAGLPDPIVPSTYTIEALVDALAGVLTGSRSDFPTS